MATDRKRYKPDREQSDVGKLLDADWHVVIPAQLRQRADRWRAEAEQRAKDREVIDRYIAIRDNQIPPPWMNSAASSEPSADAGLDPFKTGAPGRPTAKTIILTEAARRIREHAVTPQQGRLTAFSVDLEDWWEHERLKYKPPGPTMTASSIRSCGVRALWNTALSGVGN